MWCANTGKPMTDFIDVTALRPDFSDAHLGKRYGAERRFKLAGIGAIAIALGMLALLFVTILISPD